ncbi:MAG: cupin domain-containing protein [Bacteroidota bacterium]
MTQKKRSLEKKKIDNLVQKLELQPHPEGGFFKETYRSELIVEPKSFNAKRNVSTAIYFLLTAENFSAFHKIKSDELWHFYQGDPLEVIILEEDKVQTIKLGSNLEKGETFQAVVSAGSWFASRVTKGGKYSLVGCTVAPGFDFEDFELAQRVELIKSYPEHSDLITEMTRS